MRQFIAPLLVAAAALTPLLGQAQDAIKLGYAKCAHCTPLALTPQNADASKVKLEATGFNTGNDVLTALLSKSIDVAQVTYLHYATALDKGFDVVAISGQINGGSQILVGNDVPVAENDWAGLKKVIADYKTQGKPFRVAASRGNAQDIHMRGAFAKQGIDINKDVQFINIPNPSDHVQALRRGEVELICSVDPFATQIREVKAAKFFTYPYDQAAGKLTNLIVTRSDVIASKPKAVEETVRSIVKVNELMTKDKGLFIDTIQKVTGLDKAIATGAASNLYPDYQIHRASAVAIAQMMRDLKYINTDVTAAVEKNIDYRFLEAATGKPKSQLGY
ncbi:ABC transporter substrate-binding protein [Pseudacidovorax sp. RU35E]|uniref:ABC transporter substrate-binding protein n=1 Tax=Pseudacidovorax sp. RU35E TaxID=1907403 RepID=UPI000955AC32|nr:ABC transporter substrate-binding protein [Pseudacidovorax sp. RU35E]SIQ11634.1 ABC-type nitrate/sulfonate/bicarbonate transport system, substrate-binding protein [Pseudacidovorax sp. RU35E]